MPDHDVYSAWHEQPFRFRPMVPDDTGLEYVLILPARSVD
jgi:hypothetical protein